MRVCRFPKKKVVVIIVALVMTFAGGGAAFGIAFFGSKDCTKKYNKARNSSEFMGVSEGALT